VPPQPPLPFTGLDLKELCEENHVLWDWDSISQVVTLDRGGVKARALIDSEIVIVGTDKVTLSHPITWREQAIIVPPDFEERIIDQLTATMTLLEPVVYKVVIDAGHGGKDPGAIGRTGLYEKEVALDIARRLTDVLKQKGFDVSMTRNKDEFLTLEERTEIASQQKPDLFVSVHANSCRTRRVSGVEVYSLRELSWEEKKEPQRKKNKNIMFGLLKMKKGDPVLEDVIADMLYTHKREKSSHMALQVAKDISGCMATDNRGHRTAGFFVLRNTLCPSILVEVGFLSNIREEKLLRTSSYRQKIADSLAESIYNYAVMHGL